MSFAPLAGIRVVDLTSSLAGPTCTGNSRVAVQLGHLLAPAEMETLQIEEIEQVWWEDLMPECLWKFRVKDFGPLIVAVDSHGNSQYQAIQERAAARIAALEL
jgi:tartrate dehydratase beta subunit/fumarate hydratase class I family protein